MVEWNKVLPLHRITNEVKTLTSDSQKKKKKKKKKWKKVLRIQFKVLPLQSKTKNKKQIKTKI